MIVNGHVHVFPSAVAEMMAANSVDAVPDTAKTAQFLDVQMQQGRRDRRARSDEAEAEDRGRADG